MTDPVPLRIEREFHAPPEDLYRAWTESPRMRDWFQPAGAPARRVDLDARAGGGFEAEFALEDGDSLVVAGRYRELEARKIVFELIPRRRAGAGTPSLVTVELVPRANATTLVLRHEGLLPGDREQFREGWQICFARLAGSCGTALEAFYSRLQEFPRFRSRFGGLWPDLSDARARLAGKQALGLLDAEDARLFAHWMEKGFVVLEGAVAPELAERLKAELDQAWLNGDAHTRVEIFADNRRSFVPIELRHRDQPHKVLDYHAYSATARAIQFAPRTVRFLNQLFERPPLAFQSLFFRWGTEQDMHQDTAYVLLRSPMELVGSWVALEDVRPGSGELQYFVGSHRIPEYVWFDRSRAKPYELDDERDFLRWVREQSELAGCPLVRFHPKQGDVLLWHADLVHGGSKREHRNLTRQSLVTHYCPVNVDPLWMDTRPSHGKLEHAPGCFYCFPLPG